MPHAPHTMLLCIRATLLSIFFFILLAEEGFAFRNNESKLHPLIESIPLMKNNNGREWNNPLFVDNININGVSGHRLCWLPYQRPCRKRCMALPAWLTRNWWWYNIVATSEMAKLNQGWPAHVSFELHRIPSLVDTRSVTTSQQWPGSYHQYSWGFV